LLDSVAARLAANQLYDDSPEPAVSKSVDDQNAPQRQSP
jgi:hypothetical protein